MLLRPFRPALALMFAATTLTGQTGAPLTAEAILTKLAAMESARNKRLPSYKVTREYQLQLLARNKSVKSTAEFEYQPLSGKRFVILAENGAEGLYRRALRKLMEAEVKAVTVESEVEVGPHNYTATLLGTEIVDGKTCHVLSLSPKRNSKFLIKGKAWIDAAEFGLVRLEGHPTESLSFWVGKPFISQTFNNVGGHWLLTSNKSLVEAKIVGHLELTIRSSNYTLKPIERKASSLVLASFDQGK